MGLNKYQKSVFAFINPFANILGYLLIYGIFSGSFLDSLELLFSYNYGGRKKSFSSNT